MVCWFRSDAARGLASAILLSWGIAHAAGAGTSLALESLDGEAQSLAPDATHPVVVAHFWASWCPSCEASLDLLQELAAGCPGLRPVAVNVGESAALVRRYAAERGLSLELLRDPEGEVWRELSGVGLPIDWLAEPVGARVLLGPRDREAWAALLAPHCGAPR